VSKVTIKPVHSAPFFQPFKLELLTLGGHPMYLVIISVVVSGV
jgi:hypothetical protein